MNTTQLMRRAMYSIRLFAVAMTILMASSPWFSANAATMCNDKGGPFKCTNVVGLTPFTYRACDDTAAYAGRIVAWCKVNGGTWNYQIDLCVGANGIYSTSGAATAAGSAWSSAGSARAGATTPRAHALPPTLAR